MPWPALLLSGGDAKGTHYIHGRDFPAVLNRHHPKGQAWKYRGKWTTYMPSRDLAYKNVDRLGVDNDDQFWRVMNEAEAAGQGPPTSMADLFLSCYDQPLPRGSVVSPFKTFRFGGWPMTNLRGRFEGTAYLYDLISAYRWAASSGLPNLKTAHPTKTWSRHKIGVWLAHVPFNVIPYARSGGYMMVTSEERDFFDLQHVSGAWPVFGYVFDDLVSMEAIFNRVDKRYPSCAKRIGRAFWGMWNTRHAPIQCSWRNGPKEREMKNPFFNPIWSAFITSRIKLRLAHWSTDCLWIYTDEICLTEPCIPVGTDIGSFKLKATLTNPWVKWAGHYGDDSGLLKHSGIRATIPTLGD